MAGTRHDFRPETSWKLFPRCSKLEQLGSSGHSISSLWWYQAVKHYVHKYGPSLFLMFTSTWCYILLRWNSCFLTVVLHCYDLRDESRDLIIKIWKYSISAWMLCWGFSHTCLHFFLGIDYYVFSFPGKNFFYVDESQSLIL